MIRPVLLRVASIHLGVTRYGLIASLDGGTFRMMTVYFVVLALCSGFEGCVEERKPGPTYASRAICMESARAMTPRKGVKFKCRSERSWMVDETQHAVGHASFVSTDGKLLP